MGPPGSDAWIFVSHASSDLARVRAVRNYLESKGASPLLFHLLALDTPEKFWPIIESEIKARNFFLYCESAAASASEWVRRERTAVGEVAKSRAVRIGALRVDGPSLDLTALDDFLRATRVFPSYARADAARVKPFLSALEEAGFSVFRDDDLTALEDWHNQLQGAMQEAARDGWVVIFVSPAALASRAVMHELQLAHQHEARTIPVLLEMVDFALVPPYLRDLNFFRAVNDPAQAPMRLVAELLVR